MEWLLHWLFIVVSLQTQKRGALVATSSSTLEIFGWGEKQAGGGKEGNEEEKQKVDVGVNGSFLNVLIILHLSDVSSLHWMFTSTTGKQEGEEGCWGILGGILGWGAGWMLNHL